MPKEINIDSLFSGTGDGVARGEEVPMDDLFSEDSNQKYEEWVKGRGGTSALRGFLSQGVGKQLSDVGSFLGSTVLAPFGYAKHGVDTLASKASGLKNVVPAEEIAIDALLPKDSDVPIDLPGNLENHPIVGAANALLKKRAEGNTAAKYAIGGLRGGGRMVGGVLLDPLTPANFISRAVALSTALSSAGASGEAIKSAIEKYQESGFSPEVFESLVEGVGSAGFAVGAGKLAGRKQEGKTPSPTKVEEVAPTTSERMTPPPIKREAAPAPRVEEAIKSLEGEFAPSRKKPLLEEEEIPLEGLFEKEGEKVYKVRRGVVEEVPPGEAPKAGPQEGIIKVGPNGPEVIESGKGTSPDRVLRNYNKNQPKELDLTRAEAIEPSHTNVRFDKGVTNLERAGKIGEVLQNDRVQGALHFAEGVFNRAKEQLAAFSDAPLEKVSFGGLLDRVVPGKRVFGVFDEAPNAIYINPMEIAAKVAELVIKKPALRPMAGRLLQAKMIANVVHELTHAADRETQHLNASPWEPGRVGSALGTRQERFLTREQTMKRLAGDVRREMMKIGDDATWNRTFKELVGAQMKIASTLKKGELPTKEAINTSAPRTMADEMKANPVEDLSGPEAGGMRAAFVGELVGDLAKGGYKWVKEGNLKHSYQATLAGGLLTAMNNAYNAGARYIGLGTIADAVGAIGSKESRGRLKGKALAAMAAPSHFWDSMNAIIGRETGTKSLGEAKTMQRLTEAHLPEQLTGRFWHLFGSDVQTPTGARKLTPTEHVQRALMALSIMQERTIRIGILQAEMQPIMDQLGVRDWASLEDKLSQDPSLRGPVSDALANASTMALDITSALPPMPGQLKQLVQLVQNAPGAWLAMPFPNFMLANLPQQILESNPITTWLSKRTRESFRYPSEARKLGELTTKKDTLRAEAGQDPTKLKAYHEFYNKEYLPTRSRVESLRGSGVKSRNQILSQMAAGPLVVSLFAALRASNKEDEERDYYQVRMEDGKVKDIRPLLGALAPWALMGDYIGRLATNTEKPEREHFVNFKEEAEALTGERFGGPTPFTLYEMLQGPNAEDTWENTIKKLGFSYGQVAGKMGWIGDTARLAGEYISPEEERIARTFSTQKKGDPLAFRQGFQSQVPFVKEKLPPAYESTTGRKRVHEEPLGDVGEVGLPGRVKTLGVVEGYLQKHSKDINPRDVLLGATHVPEYDEVMYGYFEKEVERKVVPLIKNPNIGEEAKREKFIKLMQGIRKVAHTRAKKEALKKDFPLPSSTARGLEEKQKREELRRENPGLFRKKSPPRPVSDRISKGEERRLREKAVRELHVDELFKE